MAVGEGQHETPDQRIPGSGNSKNDTRRTDKTILLFLRKKTRRQQPGLTPGHHFLGRGSSGTDYYYCDDLPHGRGILSFPEKWNRSAPEQNRGSCPHRKKTAIRRSGRDLGEGKRRGRNQSQPCCRQASFTRVVSPLMKRGWVLREAVRSRRMPSALACSL